MQEESTFKIKNLRKTGIKKDPVVDGNGEVVQPGSRILKGYWGDWLVFGSKVPGYTLKLKIRITPSGSKIRLINPLMTPDNNWENKRTSVYIDWGDGRYDKFYKKKINSGRFNRNSPYTLEHNYTAQVGDEMWLSITSIEPLVPYGCDIIEMLGQFPYDRYDLNMDRDGHYCGLFGVDQYVEEYPELNKLYGAGRNITKVSADLLHNWRNITNMDRMFEGWGLIIVPEGFFRYDTKFHPDNQPDNVPKWQVHNAILDTCTSYYRTFANCPNLTTVAYTLLGTAVGIFTTTEEMFVDCPKLTNTLAFRECKNLETTERMYANCKALTTVREDFMSGDDGNTTYDGLFPNLVNANSMFENCISLVNINFEKFMVRAPKVMTARYMFKNTSITVAALKLSDKRNLRDITGIFMDCKKLKVVEFMFGGETGSFNDNSDSNEDKLTIAHMFDGSGDRETGMTISEMFFQSLKRGSSSALASDCTYVFHNAVLKNAPSDAKADGSWKSTWLFARIFENEEYRSRSYDISHIMDGVVIKHSWVKTPDFYANNAIGKADYALANSTWDEVPNNLFFMNDRGSWSKLKSVKGLFYGATIRSKIPECLFNRVERKKQPAIEDFSEMFANVKYSWPNLPVDYIVNTSASFCDMSRMFKGSNITTYRPIHWRSNDRCIYDLTDFSSNAFSAPKEWMLDGYTDRSSWEPTIAPKPFILWINVDSVNRTVSLAGDATGSIDWGDSSTDKGLSSGNMTHTYASAGNYKISVVSTKSHQPTATTMNRVFRVDGEIPYDTELDLTQPLPRGFNDADRFLINYVGPRVAAVCKNVKLSCHGYISPSLLKYGSNSGYKEGLKFVDVVDPMVPKITFSADFVIVDKTVTMDVDFEAIPFQVGETTSVELTIGKVRVDNDLLHVDFSSCTPRNIPIRFWSNCIGHKFNKFDRVKMIDTGYIRPEHFEYRYESVLHPDINVNDLSKESGKEYLTSQLMLGEKTNEQLYSLPQLVQPKNIEMYLPYSPVYRFHPQLSSEYIGSVNTNSVISRVMTSRGYTEKNTALPYQGIHDDHYSTYDDEFMTFVLEGLNGKEDIIIYDLYNYTGMFDRNDFGKTTIEIIDPNGDLDDVIEFNGKPGTIGPFKADKLIIRIKAKYPAWLGDGRGSVDTNVRNKIVAVYGIIADSYNREFMLRNRFGVSAPDGFGGTVPALAPNIRNIGESVLWGIHNYQMDDMFNGTKLEVIPPNIFAYTEATSFKNCFRKTKIKRVPDHLWCNDISSLYIGEDGVTLDISGAFEGCENLEYVFEPIDPEMRASVLMANAFKGCKTYACKNSTEIEKDVFKNQHIVNPTYYHSELGKMTSNASIPELTHDNLIAINRESIPESALVSVNTTIAVNPTNLVDKWYCLDYAMWLAVPQHKFNTTTEVMSYGYTEAQYNNIFKHLINLRGFSIWENCVDGLVTRSSNVHPDHLMLINNENLLYLSNVLAGVQFNYTPNIFFINQWRMVDATGLLLRSRFDKIPEQYVSPPSHLPDKLGRPIYIGGETPATRYHSRSVDKMLRYRNNWLMIVYLLNNIDEGDLTCPTFTSHRIIDARNAFHCANTMVTDETLINIDRDSNVYQTYINDINISGIFWKNTAIKTDCRIFHIWKEVPNEGSGFEFQETVNLLHPPKDMFDALTRLTKLEETFKKSNIRDLPKCNPRIKDYPYFAAGSKLSTIPEYWFKYSGTETLDIRYAFNQCTGLIVTHKLIDPSVTVPVVKYASLENAWSIIGDDPEIFAGVNTKLDGTDKSLIRVIPETDLFRQTLDIHDNRWTLSVKALGMETIGNESVQDDNLFMVSWGDGTDPSVVSYRDIEWADYSHKYEANGRYQVMILSTQWCCYINSPQDLSSKYTTYSIDGMLQNSTCRAVCDTGLTNMFGFTVEKVFPTMFDKLSDVATVKDLPELFFNFNKLKEIPETILHKMASLESIYRFAMYTPITELPAKLLSKNPKLKNANSIAERCYSLITIPSELFKLNPDLETIQRGFCDIQTLTDVPRDLLSNNPNLLNIENMFSHCGNMVIDNTYDNFLANQTKLVNATHLFRNWTIKQLPPNLLNRCVNLQITEGMFELQDFNDAGFDSIDDARFNNFFKKMAERDTEFDIPANWLPKSVVNSGTMFFFRTKLKSYPSDLFAGNTVLNKASYMFMNTAIRRIHNETFKTMSHTSELNLTRWIYKDKRFGKTFYIHYCPKVVSSAINVPSVVTESMLLGVYGTMTEAQLFSGVKTNPSNIHSLYIQEFEPATFKLKMTGDGTFITFKPITKSDVIFTDLTMIEWGDGTDDIFEENIKKADIPKLIKHSYKKPGEYTIKVGAKYCLVPIMDDLPEAYQVNAVVFPENKDTVKQTTIGGEYGIGKVEIKSDRMFVNYHDNTDVEVSLVPRPYYVGETYTVDLIIDKKGLDVGSQTVVELDIVRDTSDPFERLEIGGTLGPMEGYTEFPKVADMPELQYSKWVGTETFFSRNTQLNSFNRSFMNLNYEFRIADKVFWPLTGLITMAHCFWNTKLVIEPGFAPDFNKNTELQSVNSMFRGGRSEDIGKAHNGVIYIPEGTPLNKVIWKVDQTNYQPFDSLNSITDYGYICHHSDITYTLTTNLSKISNMIGAYEDARSLTYLRADFFRTLNSSGPINVGSVFTDTHSLTSIQPAPDGKSLLEFTIGNNQTVNFSWTFAGSGLPVDTVVDIINKSSFINTTASGTNIDINNLFSWSSQLQSEDASALKLNIPSRTGTLDLTDLFSYDSDPGTTKYDKDITMLYNIKAGAITVAASGSPNLIVSNMFDHCYADATVSDAHKVFIVAGDDSNFNKAKALADSSALNTLTVMTTTVVPK